jgi:hypothetical protein
VADAEGFLEHDDQGTQKIRNAVACRKCHGQTADAQPGEHRIGRKAQLVRASDQEHDGKHDAD